jgi:diguanylate cyclase (GGDEF)-like protein
VLTLAVLRNALQMARINEQGARDLEAAHSRAEHLSRHDTLTGLPNRAMLMEFLERSLAAIRHDQTLALLYLDLDRFKPVNDALGHAAGDVVLIEIGQRLRTVARENDLVARVGGDEFVIVCTGLSSPTDAEPLCRRFSEGAAATIRAIDGEVQVGLSIGVATAPGDAGSPSELMRLADIAMYQAKGERRGSWQFYAAEMNERVTVRRAIEIDLRRALAAEEFFLEFQPRFNAKTLAVTSIEALVRWRHPERGVILPGSFIPIAEETGLIVPLGEWVLNEACRLAMDWKGVTVSVNLSPVQFRGGDVVENVSRVLNRTGLPPERLELELTEGVLLEDTGRSSEVLNGLKALGVGLAMDDFGTGYSSLGYLQAFPFDRLKIDRTFISRLTPNGEARSIVQAILGLGRALGMSVTAEGVETPEQLILLQADHCQEVQGFLFARPLAAKFVQDILDACPEERRRALAA